MTLWSFSSACFFLFVTWGRGCSHVANCTLTLLAFVSACIISLYGNEIGDVGATGLAGVLADNNGLLTLEYVSWLECTASAPDPNSISCRLVENRIGDVGALALASALPKNKKLTKLECVDIPPVLTAPSTHG